MPKKRTFSETDDAKSASLELDPRIGPDGYLQDHHLDYLERWLDSSFRVPGTDMRFGLDGIIGLVPVVGDVATTGMSVVFVADAYKIGASKRVIAKMMGNVGLDFAVGLIPVIGDLADFAFKSNTKNLRLLKEERQRLADAKLADMKTVS